MAAAACKTSSTLSLAEPSALPSAPTTTMTAATSAPSRPTPPLPPTVFLTKDSPTFRGLPQQLDNQASALSDIAPSLQHLLASSHNPEPQPPQSPSSQPVAATLTSATLPAANTAGSALGAPLPAAALPSINASISPGFIRIQYKGLQDLLAFVSQNPGCLLWKGDLEDAFRHNVTAEHDTHLLGFSYDSIHYHKNVLTFGGSSSLWLFNLVAEFLHWLVAACLPTDWPINHYLDNTFGTVPVSHTTHTLLPIHTLTLAANALGLQLSPKNTFGTSTKLEVMGVKIDTVTQTVRITDN
ncbi:uncharacterized protein UBRO2_04433 [Ustilago bromivora]|uniref:Uncharacterized protein n=1 Tax=Ustilago bromivora TaxID=307758 RepID=A0A8H8QS58_9BASI|nr:uncharacterized protein UBRO2_04433 [Ustilago bromivora]